MEIWKLGEFVAQISFDEDRIAHAVCFGIFSSIAAIRMHHRIAAMATDRVLGWALDMRKAVVSVTTDVLGVVEESVARNVSLVPVAAIVKNCDLPFFNQWVHMMTQHGKLRGAFDDADVADAWVRRRPGCETVY